MDNRRKDQDYSDLEHVAAYDAPEVVRGPLQRNSSTNSPQIYTPPANFKPQHEYYGGQPEVRPYYEKPPLDAVDDREAEKQAIKDSRRVKLCGLRPKIFFWVVGVIVVILVLAAVLGGVLGSQLSNSDSSSDSTSDPSNNTTASLPSIDSKTGLAAVRPDGASTLCQYYQDEQGRVIENRYDNGQWSIQGDSIPSHSIVGSDARSGSPIAATSWLSNGILFRQVFYLDGNGRIMSSNTTGNVDWPTPYSILPDDAAIPDTNALSVCADTDSNALNGLRLYFASSDLRIIREVGLDFDKNVWTLWQTFPGSDPYSGVATVLVDSINHLYVVNSSTNALNQWTWDYSNHEDAKWQTKVKSTSYIAGGSDIAAVYDGSSTEYIFYQGSDNKLTRALYYGNSISDIKAFDTLASGSKLSATYDDSSSNTGATVFFQAASDIQEIQYETINRSGETLQSGVVT